MTQTPDSYGSEANAVAVQRDGKILVAGQGDYIFELDPAHFQSVFRYNPAGGLDPSFGQNGIVVNPVAHAAQAALVQADGKIDVAGGMQVFRYIG